MLRIVKSAPLAARKQAIDAALFFSAPWVPKPMINCRNIHTNRHIRDTSSTAHLSLENPLKVNTMVIVQDPKIYNFAYLPMDE